MEKLTQEQYASIINSKKQDAHEMQWLFIEINAKELMEECEPGVRNQTVCCKAMLDALPRQMRRNVFWKNAMSAKLPRKKPDTKSSKGS